MSGWSSQWTDEQVHAFVDGELDPDTTARLLDLMKRDPLLAQRVARQQELRVRLANAFDPVLNETVPESLLQSVHSNTVAVTPIGSARRTVRERLATPTKWWVATAASVFVATMVGWNLPRSADGTLIQGEHGLVASGALAQALSERISTDEYQSQGVQVLLSFRASDGRHCRVFGLDSGVDGLACRSDSDWLVVATGHSGPEVTSSDDQYRQASSPMSASVRAAISRWQASDVMTPDEEQELRSSDWR